MKVIFLDVDGVLNRSRSVKGITAFDLVNWVIPYTVNHVNRIRRETGAVIVVSSTWRFNRKTMEEMVAEFATVGLEVVDRTPRSLSGYRGREIDQWLDLHPEVESFVILDDESDMEPHMSRLVQTHFYKGLVRDHVAKAVKILGEKYERAQ